MLLLSTRTRRVSAVKTPSARAINNTILIVELTRRRAP
jgi:hypothetical protein